ncbi:D-alanyl-D-alanine carboxypeptidase [Acidithiobacillus thiooxidans]|uniref:serine-type D-Ala-D-Ala carboxypeptidase n=2 Tax=Acidithiobacillus thiooxidans TaxID=930 RepID=A0A1C2IDH9_ACITH|nr:MULTISPECIES: D-alanyl-D-alanine carboxypeptidase family protein [Acidithiobacillus]MBU2741195.1 D-alanyl-D-alanine carboxypeptidase [Acidithiobacillus albertensis]MBU2809820.1 D-alanyl-D-alanine carboxypeptidase [Acidithiobacillus thiooxidans]MBU2837458.1 D-alanyl-D-alanine carboxypeptidase [Acidithiobacillus thiooxidans]MBU2842457.1 D-alanyl-D-alanine carboxypeptidase [Acidithiobacillus thiooxidans]MDA8176883.1 D-alanyl-D-alanine carboxypeptidase [Acidithiobacillus sp.]
MKLPIVLAITAVFSWGSVACAAVPPLPPMPTLPPPPPMPAPQLTGIQSAVLLDINSGQILMAENDEKPVNPSGLVKLMTAYLMYQAEKQGLVQPGENVHVSNDAWHAQGSRMFIQPGMPVTMTQLTHGLLIDGGNDAAIAIAETVAGSVGGFVDLMNHDAAAMGLQHTHFTNPDGLPQPGQTSTALDLARLSARLIQSYPQVMQVAGKVSYTYNHITQYNYNPLAGQNGVNGLGVGLAGKNSWNLAVSATRNGRTLVAVVLGAPSRSAAGSDASALLHYGWNGWQNVSLYKAGATVAQIHNGDWSPATVQGVTAGPVVVSEPKQQKTRLQTRFVPTPNLKTPLAAGAEIGTLQISWHGHVLKTVPVQTRSAVKPAGWFTRLIHEGESWL